MRIASGYKLYSEITGDSADDNTALQITRVYRPFNCVQGLSLNWGTEQKTLEETAERLTIWFDFMTHGDERLYG